MSWYQPLKSYKNYFFIVKTCILIYNQMIVIFKKEWQRRESQEHVYTVLRDVEILHIKLGFTGTWCMRVKYAREGVNNILKAFRIGKIR